MGELKKWRDQDWVRIGTDGKVKGKCGTSKDKKNPDRCLPRSKPNSLSRKQRATTAKKKKREGSKGRTVVKNTKEAEVKLISAKSQHAVDPSKTGVTLVSAFPPAV
mgnify:CR=1 FL=1